MCIGAVGWRPGRPLPGAAWWDSKLDLDKRTAVISALVNQFFEIEVVGDRGTVYSVDRHYFQPYDLRFAQSYHIGLSRDPRIVSTYGTTFNRAAYLKLEQVSQADIGRVIRRRGVSSYNSEYDARFADLMTRWLGFRNLNRRRDRWLLINYLAAPHHIQQLPERATFAGQTKVRQVRVRRIETFYDLVALVLLHHPHGSLTNFWWKPDPRGLQPHYQGDRNPSRIMPAPDRHRPGAVCLEVQESMPLLRSGEPAGVDLAEPPVSVRRDVVVQGVSDEAGQDHADPEQAPGKAELAEDLQRGRGALQGLAV